MVAEPVGVHGPARGRLDRPETNEPPTLGQLAVVEPTHVEPGLGARLEFAVQRCQVPFA